MWGRPGALIVTLLVGVGGAGCAAKPELATSAPVDSLMCGSPRSGSPGRLPDRAWVELALCPFRIVHVRSGEPVPSPSFSPPVIVRGDLHRLVAALAEPDDRSAPGLCTMKKLELPRFWLVDREGQAFEPQVPLGPCGQPSIRVVEALSAITDK